MHEHVWPEMFTTRMAMVRRWEEAMAEAVELLGTDRPAGRRLAETREFFAFMRAELPEMLRRWEERRASR